jgi:hypothetical protein
MSNKFYAAAIVLLTLTSCNKLPFLKTLNIEVPYSKDFDGPKLDTAIQLPNGGLSYSTPAEMMETHVKQQLIEHGLTENQVTKITINSYMQHINSGNFDFVDSVGLFLSARDMPEIMVAGQTSIPKNSTDIQFICTQENLMNYLMKDTVYIRIQGHFNKVPAYATYHSDLLFTIGTNLKKED